MSGPVLLAAGGTGGHLFPAMALAEELMARGLRVACVTDHRGGALARGFGPWPTYVVRAGQIQGKGIGGRMLGALDLVRGTLEAHRLLREIAPAVVIGFGGYPSVLPLLAAMRGGLATMIHEQNAVLGRANRLLARRVRVLALSFADTQRVAVGLVAKTRITGNPVRRDVAAVAIQGYVPPRPGQPFNLLVMGGSLGARVMSAIVPAAIAALPPALRASLRVQQQCRADDLEEVAAHYRESAIEVELKTFFDDVPARLAAAHLVIARSGASTVAELAATGRPAVLVPYRFAADDHQTANARGLECVGGGWLMPEPAFAPEALAARLETLMRGPDLLAVAAAAAKTAGHPRAAHALAELVLGLVPANGGNTSVRQAQAA
ncbi:MAG: undecaprenyldiphospho-muramoylpentapeptide beta-N-acetylglucosaminyltransferase [Alphaproteobacteria bacterium]|nr:undecaprenyldiphospho-muramoylpentapeptide beta-N-acetylglucosaminyltransferase [Alphaproteobacteria bacterium]